MYFPLGLALSVLLSVHVHAETRFRRPPGPGPNRDYHDNPKYEIGEKLNIQWEMEFDNARILILQQDANQLLPKEMSAKIVSSTYETIYKWTVTLEDFSADFDKTLSNVYYFRLEDVSNGETEKVTSHYFNITDPADSTTTSASATKTSAASKSGSQTGASTSSTEMSDSGDDGDEGLSRGALIGVSVGVTLGGLAVLAGLGFLLWKYLRRHRSGRGKLLSPEHPMQEGTPGSLSTTIVTSPGQQYYQSVPQIQYHEQTHELPPQSRIHEAPN
ncbi:hypothetical protein G7Z17_g5559 [Cylindrodendrum hubeiense]|uniref:Mid2 domain-containing protein n=1 Tax=Cylindrodendrum hubeiense TaxID=595255 RepID=A0A9P5HDX7_9HYPO|nr:hypothetical protein G7Z17_g5559 [Cylindrodendrum hubeiense]